MFGLATVSQAQTFEFRYGGKPLPDGATVTIQAEPDEFFPEELNCNTNPSGDPTNGLILSSVSGSDLKGSATIEIVSNTLSPKHIQWCMGGQCVPMTESTLTKSFETSNGITQVQFEAANVKEGRLEAVLRATVSGEQHTVNIVMTNGQTATTQQLWWTNHDADENAGWYYQNTPQNGRYNAATFIPYDFVGGEGTTIDGFSFFPYSLAMANVQVWVSTRLPEPDGSGCLEVKDVGELKFEEFNDVLFSRGYEIPEGGLYVGFSFDIIDVSIREGNRALLRTLTSLTRNGAFFLNSPDGAGWKEVSGNLVSRVCFGSDNFTDHRITPYDFDPVYTMKGTTTQVPVYLLNYGISDITDISYVVTSDGVASAEQHASASIPGIASHGGFCEGSFLLTLSADNECTPKEKLVTITKINGVPIDGNKFRGMLTTLDYQSSPTLLMEEFTGTWCGWCTRGFAGLQLVNETYGDRVQTIALHYGDPMETSAYSWFSPGSYPKATVNRGTLVDPYIGIVNHIENVLKTTFPGEITATACWADEAKTSIRIDTRTKLGFNAPDSPFAIGYVLVEDGMKGTTSEWAQYNFYSNNPADAGNDPRLMELVTKPQTIIDMVYDHVAIDGWGVHYGVNGSISGQVVSGKEIESTYRADISANGKIQDKSKLYVVALLIEKATGKVYAAGKALIGDYQPSGLQPSTCAEVIAGADGDTFRVTGICKSISNTTYGNWYLEDETGQIYIYGTLDAQVKTKNFSSLGIEVGNEVTVEGPKKTYNGTVELVDVKVLDIRKPSVTVTSVSPAGAVVPKEGGDVTVTMANFAPGIIVNTHVPLLASTWLKYDYIVNGEQLIINFHVAANAGDQRSADVKLICSGEKAYSLVTISQETGVDTGIAGFERNDKLTNEEWYNLKGQRLSEPPAQGLYLRKGKKVYVK